MKTLKFVFVGYVENNLYVVDFFRENHYKCDVLIRKGGRGLVVAWPFCHVNMITLQSIHMGNHVVRLKNSISFAEDGVC
jgi:hypothetical protein